MRIFKILLSLFFLFLLLSKVNANKIGLLVGVGKYAVGTQWKTLSSANDIVLIKKALLAKGFNANDIIVLQDSLATREGIINAIETLIQRAEKDDVVYFHFSGHGQQLYDDNGDEEDGLDESIVPYDAPMRFRNGQKEKHIRDDYLNIAFEKLCLKIGIRGQLIVSIDACHSGTGTRGVAASIPIVRGTNVIYGDKPSDASTSNQDGNFGLIANQKSMAPMVCFFGSGPQELNYQYQIKDMQVGSLSYSIYKAFERTNTAATFRDVFDKIKTQMALIAPLQSPQAEGNLDFQLFNGEIIPRKKYFTISSIIDSKTVKINGGYLQGIDANATVKFYKENAADTIANNILVIGKVEQLDFADATIVLQKPISTDEIQFTKAYTEIKKQPFSITLNAGKNTATVQLIKSALADMDNVILTNNAAQINVSVTAQKEILLINQTGDTLGSWNMATNNNQLRSLIAERIAIAARSLFLKSLNTKNEAIQLTAELVQVEYETVNGVNKFVSEDSVINTSIITNVHNKTGFKIRIKNDGTEKAYFSIIDIQPNDTFNILLTESPSSYSINPMETKTFPEGNPVFTVGPPYGKEIMKIIASTLPIEYNITSTRGVNHSFKNLEEAEEGIENISHTNTRGLEKSFGINVVTLMYKIVH